MNTHQIEALLLPTEGQLPGRRHAICAWTVEERPEDRLFFFFFFRLEGLRGIDEAGIAKGKYEQNSWLLLKSCSQMKCPHAVALHTFTAYVQHDSQELGLRAKREMVEATWAIRNGCAAWGNCRIDWTMIWVDWEAEMKGQKTHVQGGGEDFKEWKVETLEGSSGLRTHPGHALGVKMELALPTPVLAVCQGSPGYEWWKEARRGYRNPNLNKAEVLLRWEGS